MSWSLYYPTLSNRKQDTGSILLSSHHQLLSIVFSDDIIRIFANTVKKYSNVHKSSKFKSQKNKFYCCVSVNFRLGAVFFFFLAHPVPNESVVRPHPIQVLFVFLVSYSVVTKSSAATAFERLFVRLLFTADVMVSCRTSPDQTVLSARADKAVWCLVKHRPFPDGSRETKTLQRPRRICASVEDCKIGSFPARCNLASGDKRQSNDRSRPASLKEKNAKPCCTIWRSAAVIPRFFYYINFY